MLRTLAAIVVLHTALPAATTPAPPGAAEVESFLGQSTPVCTSRPAAQCVDRFFAASATDKRGLTAADVVKLRQNIGAWYQWRSEGLAAQERAVFGLGLMFADSLGPDRVHGAFDSNRDGFVSKAELLADVKLDQRPLGQVLADPKAVDRQGLAQRLGLPVQLLNSVFAAGKPPGP
jgi:hypothetical protein